MWPLFQRRLLALCNGKACTSFPTAIFEHLSAARCLFANQEPVGRHPLFLTWLVCSFWHITFLEVMSETIHHSTLFSTDCDFWIIFSAVHTLCTLDTHKRCATCIFLSNPVNVSYYPLSHLFIQFVYESNLTTIVTQPHADRTYRCEAAVG